MRFAKLLSIAVFAVAVATAADYKIQLAAPVKVGTTELKAGQYKFAVEGSKVVFKSGNSVVAESPATVENAKQKYENTEISTANSNLQTISVGGTNMTIVLKAK